MNMWDIVDGILGEVVLFLLCVGGGILLYKLRKWFQKGGGVEPSQIESTDSAEDEETSDQVAELDERDLKKTATERHSKEGSIERQWLTVRVTWVATSLALASCLVVATVTGPGTDPSNGRNYVLGGAVLVVSVVLLAGTNAVRRTIANLEGPSRGGDSLPLLSAVLRAPILNTYNGRMLVVAELCLLPGVCGLILFLVERDFLWPYLLVGISAAALILLRPRKKELIDLALRSKQGH